MTLLEIFKLDHPNAPMGNNGVPITCPRYLGYLNEEECKFYNDGFDDCETCWNREYEGETCENGPQGIDEVKTKLTITLELHELNNFTLAGKIFEICQNDNIHYLDALTIARMLEAEVHNERRKKDDVQRKIGYGAS